MNYMKLAMALVVTCIFMMPALSMVPGMERDEHNCPHQMCDRQNPEMGQKFMHMLYPQKSGMDQNNMQMMSGCKGDEMEHNKMMSGCKGHEMKHNKMIFVCQGQKIGHDKMMFVCQKAHTDSPEIGEMREREGFGDREGSCCGAKFGEGRFGEGEKQEVMSLESGHFDEFIPYEFVPYEFNESGFDDEEEEE